MPPASPVAVEPGEAAGARREARVQGTERQRYWFRLRRQVPFAGAGLDPYRHPLALTRSPTATRLAGNPGNRNRHPEDGCVTAGVYVQAISAYARIRTPRVVDGDIYSDEAPKPGYLKGYCHPIRF